MGKVLNSKRGIGTIEILVGIAAIGVLVFLLVSAVSSPSQTSQTVEPPAQGQAEPSGQVHEFEIAGGNYYFSIEEIKVNVGDTVRIVFSSEEGFHDWVVDEFDAATKRLRPEDGQDTIEFVADKAGEFEYYCSVGEHRALGQVGKLIVE